MSSRCYRAQARAVSVNDCYPLCVHRPPVQLSVASATPSHRRPPCLGSGAVHSLLRCLSHSGVHADHSPHSLQLPSTEEDTDTPTCDQTQVKDGCKVYIKPHFMELLFIVFQLVLLEVVGGLFQQN